MKRILFPTDFSEVATNAFVHALEFAKIVQGEIILLHTFDLPIFDNQFFPENYMVIYESVELSQFDMFKDEIPKLRAIAEERNLDKIKMSHRLMDGDLVFNINKAIKDDKIDYVVMGTAGASGWSEFFSGTNTGAVLMDVKVPLLCVPLDAQFKKIHTIGFTTRFRPKDKKALKKVLEIAKMAHADLKCLYVKTEKSDVDKETIKKWEEEFADEPIEFFVIASDEVKETILDFILYKEIDMLTMLTYKRSFFEGLFHPSLTKKFANSFDVPILSIHIE
ncbi:universal stress protein [Flavobacterium granuli]|uniref:Nucleotide-binding universal stress UspA family protein n=1 Tax=Flavobacterium granuli TaxID=280093 RepID=A0A1M5T734_9FLAO|nr:universal stress protein [Flavobacterium granuli]PRZ20715.1 nucleotide-binding universal stress UspA family protein [Flavobacterium granuli]SHH46420.1 Nucleotide-binding universal stress protein, UspA family [Flavobacterium granuli]